MILKALKPEVSCNSSMAGVQLDTSPIANGYRKLCWAIVTFACVASPAGYKGNDIPWYVQHIPPIYLLNIPSKAEQMNELIHIFKTKVIREYNNNFFLFII